MSSMKHNDNMWQRWIEAATQIYDPIYYEGNSLVNRVNDSGHRLIETKFNSSMYFDKVLEVGAGTGRHFPFVKHAYGQYVMSDISSDLLDKAKALHGSGASLSYELADATKLHYGDNQFDRLISVYNLEHLPQPHKVLLEWDRVVKPGGIISIAIPLDGGVAWRLGRHLTTRRAFAKYGLDLDYIIAREHINPSYNLISLIRHYFGEIRESWYPLGLKMIDLNLVYCCEIKKSNGR